MKNKFQFIIQGQSLIPFIYAALKKPLDEGLHQDAAAALAIYNEIENGGLVKALTVEINASNGHYEGPEAFTKAVEHLDRLSGTALEFATLAVEGEFLPNVAVSVSLGEAIKYFNEN